MSTSTVAPTSPLRRLSAFLFRHPRVKLGATLGTVLLWFVVIYLGALAFLFVNAFWRLDPFSGLIVRQWGLWNFQALVTEPVWRIIAFRTVGVETLEDFFHRVRIYARTVIVDEYLDIGFELPACDAHSAAFGRE